MWGEQVPQHIVEVGAGPFDQAFALSRTFGLGGHMATASELNMNKGASALEMAQTIFGNGVQVTGASYSGSSYSSATYWGGDSITTGVTPGDQGIILSTGSVDFFTRPSGDPNKSNSISVNSGGQNNRADFNAIAGRATYDASVLTATFIPDADVMTMQFVFSSDEYPEYSNSIYNDVVGVWINGNHVPLSVTESPAAVTEINQNENINLYVDNTGDDFNTEMDGFTLTMTLTIPVDKDDVNTIVIGIADTSDSSYDSNLLIAANSLQTNLVANSDDLTLGIGGTKNLDILDNDDNLTGGTLKITHINGVGVMAGDEVILPTGQTIKLLSDGTIDVVADNDEETINFTYGVEALDSNDVVLEDDVGFVTVKTIPCFVAGTHIRTMQGEVPVENLEPGDWIMTLDNGPQQLRWIGQRTVSGQGNLAPIRIRAGTFGSHGKLLLSPQHRVLVHDVRAEMFFGEDQVLVAAKDLVNDRSVRQVPQDKVTYVHLLFDEHQVIWSEGLATESFLPGPQTTAVFEQDIVDEITEIFPELNALTGEGYSPAARRTLKHYEAAVLMGRLS